MEIRIFDNSLEKFIKNLQKPTIAKLLRTTNLLEKFGQKLGPPHTKKISTCLFELRISGKQEVRIFYSFHKSQIFLLHGFVKKSQKIPQREVKAAFQKLKLVKEGKSSFPPSAIARVVKEDKSSFPPFAKARVVKEDKSSFPPFAKARVLDKI